MAEIPIFSASILIVDDQQANVRLLEKTLLQAGYKNVAGVTDPVEGLALTAKTDFDLLLLDLNMPEIDGFRFMATMKDRLHDVDDEFLSIIVITAQTDAESRIRALETGARDFITKPFDRVELLTRIRNILEIRLMHNSIKNQNKQLENRVKDRTLELEQTRLEVIRRLGRAAEYRDNETGLHILRMSNIAAVLARGLGLQESWCELILNASPMHDVGKIGIPDEILLKKGKFTPAEWEIMKTHVDIGGEILSGNQSDLLDLARVIAMSHHEKWDGSGYPHALKGEAIPLAGRIVAVADVFDALTSERPYKKAWTVDDAVAHISSESGKHFEPRVVEIFKSVLPEVILIRDAYPEPSRQEDVPRI